MPLARAFRAALAMALAAIVLPFLHMGAVLTGEGDLGHKTAMGDRMKQMYPYHFVPMVEFLTWVQSSRNTFPAAYYEREHPIMLESARAFALHPYFRNPHVKNTSLWHGMIHQRVSHFRRLLDEEGRRDFDVEKDRCAMQRFFTRHGLPMLPLHGEWHSLEQVAT